METYGKSKTGDGHAPGGVGPAHARNPNEAEPLNDSVDGPFSHMMGFEGDGGTHGDKAVTKNSNRFYMR